MINYNNLDKWSDFFFFCNPTKFRSIGRTGRPHVEGSYHMWLCALGMPTKLLPNVVKSDLIALLVVGLLPESKKMIKIRFLNTKEIIMLRLSSTNSHHPTISICIKCKIYPKLWAYFIFYKSPHHRDSSLSRLIFMQRWQEIFTRLSIKLLWCHFRSFKLCFERTQVSFFTLNMKHCHVHACLHACAGREIGATLTTPKVVLCKLGLIRTNRRTHRISNLQGSQWHLPTTLKKIIEYLNRRKRKKVKNIVQGSRRWLNLLKVVMRSFAAANTLLNMHLQLVRKSCKSNYCTEQHKWSWIISKQ